MDVKDWTLISFEEGRHQLLKWRQDNSRRSEECVEIWEHVLSRKPSALGDEPLDCARLDIAQECITALRNKFPKSQRVLKLEAMRLEALGKFDDALQCYDALIKRDDSNALYRKRKVAVYKSQGKLSQAIEELTHYLQKFMNDSEAWMELSHLYLAEMDYAKAAHCAEELILTNPHNFLFHLRYAEIKYTQGGPENLDKAKSYYCQAAHLNPNCLRALFGAFLCASHLALGKAGDPKKRGELTALAAWAAEKINERYVAEALNNPDIEPTARAVNAMMKSLQASVS